MKTVVTLSFFIVIFAVVNCKHTFLGANVQRPLLQHVYAQYDANLLTKRIANYRYTIPSNPEYVGKFIQGILAYDKTGTGATANITEGGLGNKFVNIRMKSDRGKPMKFDIYIYA